MKKTLLRLLLLFVPVFFCAAQVEEGMAGRLSSVSASLSAAHTSLPSGTRIRVTNLETGRNIVVVVNRRLNADSGHLVELTVPAAEAIGMRDETRVLVERLQTDGTLVPASDTSAEVSDATQVKTGAAESRDNRETAAGQSPAPRKETETKRESPLPGFYYINSYDGEYPGVREDSEPPPESESASSPGEIVTLPSEHDSSPQSPLVQARPSRPVPPPPVEVRPAPPAPVPPPAEARPVPPAPVPPPESASPLPPPQASPQSDKETASAQLALPAATSKMVLSMNRDESGKLWVYVESETAREITIMEVPRPAPVQTPVQDQASPQTEPAPQAQTPPPVPPPAPEHRQVTVSIIPRLPPAGDGKRYVLQTGSYRDRGIAEYHLFNLQNAGIAAVTELHGADIRIIINGVYAEDIPALAEKLGKAGITEIWVRDR